MPSHAATGTPCRPTPSAWVGMPQTPSTSYRPRSSICDPTSSFGFLDSGFWFPFPSSYLASPRPAPYNNLARSPPAMTSYRKNIFVGATVLVALAFLAVMILLFGEAPIRLLRASQTKIQFVADTAEGISNGSPIYYL